MGYQTGRLVGYQAFSRLSLGWCAIGLFVLLGYLTFFWTILGLLGYQTFCAIGLSGLFSGLSLGGLWANYGLLGQHWAIYEVHI